MGKTNHRVAIVEKSESAVGGTAAKAWRDRAKEVEAVPAGREHAPNVDLQGAAGVVLSWVERLSAPTLTARVKRLAAAGEVPDGLLANATGLAWAAIHVRRQQLLALGSHSEARVSAELDARSAALRDRMLRLCEYLFADDPALGPKVAHVRQGTGYLDRANDLDDLADLYTARHEVVSTDRKHYRAEDVADARAVAAELYGALAPGAPAEALVWTSRAAKVWPLLRDAAMELQRVGRFLVSGEEGERAFPSLVSAARERPARSTADDVSPTPDGPTPAG